MRSSLGAGAPAYRGAIPLSDHGDRDSATNGLPAEAHDDIPAEGKPRGSGQGQAAVPAPAAGRPGLQA